MEDKKSNKLKKILTFATFIAIVGAVFILNIAVPAPEILVSERRSPAAFPNLSADAVLSGEFMDGFGPYAADTFILRDAWRTIKAGTTFYAFRQNDKSGLYFGAAGMGKFEKTDETSLRQTAEKIKKAAEIFSETENVYYSIIPDKSLYAGKYFPGFDLALIEDVLRETLPESMKYISLSEKLEAEMFYKTDIHWDQSKILSVAEYICASMNTNLDVNYQTETAGEFGGVYSGQMALPHQKDTMTYYIPENIRAEKLNTETFEFEPCEIYVTKEIAGVDPYNVFLYGPEPLITLYNENETAPGNAIHGRELYLFRDSFGSSLAPLLAGAYSKITIIDLRYIDLRILEQFVEIKTGSDALFIYGSQILNNPSVLLTG